MAAPAAVSDLALERQPHLTAPKAEWSDDLATDMVDRLVSAGVTAALVFGGREATLVARAVGQRGLRVPPDLALVSCDDEAADLAEVRLTAAAPPKLRVGRMAAEVLLRRLAEGDACPVHQVKLRPRICGPHFVWRSRRCPRLTALTPTREDPMRIGIIGAGAVAPLHARAAHLLPDVQLTAVCDLQPVAAAAVADPIGATVFTDYRDLLASGTTDAVIVNTPHDVHREMAVAAAEAGQHVLVEKPMATTLADCDAMTDAAQRRGVVMRVGHIQHYLPEKTALAQAVAAGAIGAVRLVHDFRTTDYRPGSRSPWFLSRDVAGGGAMMNIGAHCFDRVVWLGGSPAATVSATTLSRFGVAVETDATVTLRLANGVAASVTVVSDSPRPTDEVTVVGDDGILVANPRVGTLLRRDGTSEVLHEPSTDDIPEAFRLQLADFASAVAGGAFAVTLAHSRHVVELVLATYASADADGQTVVLSNDRATVDATR